MTGKARASEKFLRQQRKKYDRGNSCTVFLASTTIAAKEHARARPQERDDGQLHCLLVTDDEDGHKVSTLMRNLSLDEGEALTLGSHVSTSTHSFKEHGAFMSKIQLKGIADKMAREASSQGTDGDEVMTKNGAVISKFSKDAWKSELLLAPLF